MIRLDFVSRAIYHIRMARLLLSVLSLILSSCSFYQLNTHSICDSVGKEELRVDSWATGTYSVSESHDVLYIKAPVYYVAAPSALFTATCPFVDGGDDWKHWWSFPKYREKRTSRGVSYLYFPLDQKAVYAINRQNRLKLTYKSYQSAPYTVSEFEKRPHRIVAAGVKANPIASVIHLEAAAEQISAAHYVAKPLSYIAWGVDAISIIPCSLVGWLFSDIPESIGAR